VSGRRAKTLRSLAAMYRAHLRQEPDPEQSAFAVEVWVWSHGQNYGRGEARLLRPYLRKEAP
jgi:hypothetical protein